MQFPDISHLRQLQKDLWSWPKSRAAVMVGAGFSLNAEPLAGVNTRFPTWRQLVRAMFDELHPSEPGEALETAGAREERFNSANALRIASEYEATFDRRKLDLLIRRLNPDSDHQPSRLHYHLLELPWADVFTTNYDTLLERTEIPGRSYQPVTKAIELTTAFSPRIIKLHGSFPSQTPFIITDEDYRIYPHQFAPFVNTVQQSLLENCFVLIGFSGDDPNFLAWTGWIRDELGGNHAPIYLVGPLSLGNAERSLLSRRGVTPIDLSPVFADNKNRGELHATALSWFLNCLSAAKPPRPESWPGLTRSTIRVPMSQPPLVDSQVSAPQTVDMSPDFRTPLTVESVAKVSARWKFERVQYPGWIVAPESKRSELWERTKFWISPLANFAKSSAPVDQVLLYRELNWRFETAMVPLFPESLEPFQFAVDAVFEDFMKGGVLSAEVTDAWLEIAFGLLREARETYNSQRWASLKSKIEKMVEIRPNHSDRNQYESVLWEMWNVERKTAMTILSKWQPSSRFPLATMWKAGLLAELDQTGEALGILRTALQEIRRALRNQGQNIELLSLEGWCTYLLASVGSAHDISNYEAIRGEFRERWEELRAWDCSPWPHKEYFNDVLSKSPPKPHKEQQKIRGFDPGRVSTSRHWKGDQISEYLPGFACIRLYEQVGIPMRLPRLNIAGEALSNACLWITPFIGFWSPALLVRVGSVKDFKQGDFLTRTRVALMEPLLADRVFQWCFRILERELAGIQGQIKMNSAQESLLEVLPEVLSRLAFKVDSSELRKTFSLALRFHFATGVRAHIRIHESCKPWFNRLFEAADDELLFEWLPDLIKSPLFAEDIHPIVPEGHVWPDPMEHFPSSRGISVKRVDSKLLHRINSATDWLLRRADTESDEGRRRAIDRLVEVFHLGLMTSDRKVQFGNILWNQRTGEGVPNQPGYALFSFLQLPAPADVDAPSIIKHRILNITSECIVGRNAEGQLQIKSFPPAFQSAIIESSYASKPIIQIAGEALGTLEWTKEEAEQLYEKAHSWWINDKAALEIATRDLFLGMSAAGPVINILHRLGQFVARVVLPHMENASEIRYKELLDWLEEVRSHKIYPSLALPYVLLHRPSQLESVANTIATDLNSDIIEAVAASAEAVRHWIHLSAIQRIPSPPKHLLTLLTQKIIFRSKPGIKSCLAQMAYLIAERRDAISLSQASLIADSLAAWHQVTIVPALDDEAEEFCEADRPDMQVRVGSLAGALSIWYAKCAPDTPEPLAIDEWRKFSKSSVLPEVRRAFSEWDDFVR